MKDTLTSQGNNNYSLWSALSEVSKYGAFSGPCFPAFGLNMERYEVFSPNAGKYGPEKSPCLNTFHAVVVPILSQET